MAEDRIATIVKEIHYWKHHKLLPEMYCDYLLALYTNGEDAIDQSNIRQYRQINLSALLRLVLQLLLIPFSFLVIYFTEFHPIMQLSILILFVGTSFWQYLFDREEGKVLSHTALIVFLLLVMLTTMFLSSEYVHYQSITNGLIFAQFIGWLYIGFKNRINYLRIASIIGILFTLFIIVL